MTASLSRRSLVAWVALGLVLRLPGLFVNGAPDDFEFVLDWGADVNAVGLGQGLSRNYGAVSFALFGLAAHWAEGIPRYWWLPFKALELAFEIGVLAALLRLTVPEHRRFVVLAYWLNPWFIWHGAYQGFWEGPHVLFGILACLTLLANRTKPWVWAAAGVWILLSWQSKPQGLVHFAAPLCLLLLCYFARGCRRPLLLYAAGLGIAVIGVSIVVWWTGGPITALWNNLRSSDGDIRISNGGPNIWRFLVAVFMWIHGASGEVHTYRLPQVISALGIGGALVLSATLLLWMFWRLSSARAAGDDPPPDHAYFALAAGAFVMSQFAPLVHINHAYGAAVLLIPLLPVRPRLAAAWCVLVAVLAYAHVARFGMGSGLLPPDDVLQRYGHAGHLAAAVRATEAFSTPDFWLRLQSSLNRVFGELPGADFSSALSLGAALAAVVITIELFDISRSGAVPGLRRAGR